MVQTKRAGDRTEIAIVGAGFYGCCLALLFRSITDRIVLIEAADVPMSRASAVNQARVHAGFHYPRSFPTARQSQIHYAAFVRDFAPAIVDDFQMLYAIAAQRSRVQSGRFMAMFRAMEADIRPASAVQRALFDPSRIEEVFACTETAFDHTVLCRDLIARIEAAGIERRFGTAVEGLSETPEGIDLRLSDGNTLHAGTVFNATYAGLNTALLASGLQPYALKHEFTEIALVTPPEDMAGLGVTVMDGPFFSLMPYPAAGAYSLTHVRYTPRTSWMDSADHPSAYALAETLPRTSRWRHMATDAARYMPCVADVTWQKSLFDVKTVLPRNETDDGRPILLHQHETLPALISVLGGKIDNIYDLFEVLPRLKSEWEGLSPHLIVDR